MKVSGNVVYLDKFILANMGLIKKGWGWLGGEEQPSFRSSLFLSVCLLALSLFIYFPRLPVENFQFVFYDRLGISARLSLHLL